MLYLEKLKNYLEGLGFQTRYVETISGATVVEGEIETGAGRFNVYACRDAARFTKPNSSVKWYYEKSNAQLGRYIQQVLEFYK